MSTKLSCGCVKYDYGSNVYNVQYDEWYYPKDPQRKNSEQLTTVYATWCEKCVKNLGPKHQNFKATKQAF